MRGSFKWVVYVALLATAACDLPTTPGTANRVQSHGPGTNSLLLPPTQYPLHLYGAPSDAWPYVTTAGTYVELPADAQTPSEYFDGRRSCPVGLVGFNAHLRMNYGLETLDFDFRGPFTFLRHVSTLPVAEGGSPWPTAVYIFHSNAYTRDDKYYAPAGNNVLLACDGHYVVNVFGNRLWVGRLYGKMYNGPIVRNPRYEDPNCGDGGGTWDPWNDPIHMTGAGSSPGLVDGDMTAGCGGSDGAGGAGSGNYSCVWDYITLEISYDGGRTWHHFWSGWVPVCDEQMA